MLVTRSQSRTLDEDTLTRRRHILGEDHPHTLHSAHNLARASIPHTAATSPNLRCSVSGRLGSPPGPAANRAITSSVPRYTCSTIRGRPSTRAEVAAYRYVPTENCNAVAGPAKP